MQRWDRRGLPGGHAFRPCPGMPYGSNSKQTHVFRSELVPQVPCPVNECDLPTPPPPFPLSLHLLTLTPHHPDAAFVVREVGLLPVFQRKLGSKSKGCCMPECCDSLRLASGRTEINAQGMGSHTDAELQQTQLISGPGCRASKLL